MKVETDEALYIKEYSEKVSSMMRSGLWPVTHLFNTWIHYLASSSLALPFSELATLWRVLFNFTLRHGQSVVDALAHSESSIWNNALYSHRVTNKRTTILITG